MEIWKEIPCFNSFYSASNLGRIKSNNRIIFRNNGVKQTINEKIITPIKNGNGYLKVRLNAIVGIQTNLTVHSLVSRTFLGVRPIGIQVNHKNGVKTDNRVENLEYCTSKENINHAWKNGLSKNEHSKKRILFDKTVFNSVIECEHYTGINRNTLSNCAKKGFFIDKKHKVVYKGIKYNSLKDASKKIGLNPKTISKYGEVIKPCKIDVKWINA